MKREMENQRLCMKQALLEVVAVGQGRKPRCSFSVQNSETQHCCPSKQLGESICILYLPNEGSWVLRVLCALLPFPSSSEPPRNEESINKSVFWGSGASRGDARSSVLLPFLGSSSACRSPRLCGFLPPQRVGGWWEQPASPVGYQESPRGYLGSL